MLACESSNAECAIKLVELFGAEKDLVNKEGKNALDLLPAKMKAYVENHIIKDSPNRL